ncbi:Vacuolar-sorting protein SNF7 [Carpediemonas membranifera]|uniref:Vacuolar-sorting protein SNF7 n=1 Tax=Carpediemonas membranifera TaxID=201153 RepID=A0A8J6BVP6_9EUKA|nr:Vacuolar-sorting protein SNF7 [Carpediemonas membranifera]QNO39403.1 vacuolar protein sorting 20-like B [Carpediemonas membranifera]|eukprot:KAG9391626.1 Vacuolar-sorting protein SNF7 [Carpediemonas membranifera]
MVLKRGNKSFAKTGMSPADAKAMQIQNNISQKTNAMTKQIEIMERQAVQYKNEARAALQAGNKTLAAAKLKQAKVVTTQAAQQRNMLNNVNTINMATQNAANAKEIAQLMKQSAAVLSTVGISIDDIEDLMDEVSEKMDEVDQIMDTLARPIREDFGMEAEVDEELQAMEAELQQEMFASAQASTTAPVAAEAEAAAAPSAPVAMPTATDEMNNLETMFD